MGKHSIDEQELLKAKVLLEHVNRKLENVQGLLNSACATIDGQQGYGIEGKRSAIRSNHAILNFYEEEINQITGFIQELIDLTKSSSETARKMIAGEIEDNVQSSTSSPAPVPTPPVKEDTNSINQNLTYLNNCVGVTVANIEGECYKSRKNISYAAGYQGQCTWYAYGRFMETTGIALNTARNANLWLKENVNDNRLSITYGIENIKSPAIAVCETDKYSSVGHVLFVEGVEYNNDGSIRNVFITESNSGWDKTGRCVVQKITYEEYKRRYWVTGYISAK